MRARNCASRAQRRARPGHVRLHPVARASQRNHHAFARRKHRIKFFARLPQNRIHRAIGGVRVVVEQHQRRGARFPRHSYAFLPGRMPPALFRGGQLFGRELRVVDKNVRARRQLPQTLVQLGVARLVVRGVHHRSRGGLDRGIPGSPADDSASAPSPCFPRCETYRRPSTSWNFRLAFIADISTGKYGSAICVSNTCFRLSRPRNFERKL